MDIKYQLSVQRKELSVNIYLRGLLEENISVSGDPKLFPLEEKAATNTQP